MATRDEEKRIVAEAEAFLKAYGIYDTLQEFLDSEEAKQMLENVYAEQIEGVVKIKQNTPENLKERADVYYKAVTQENSKEMFFKDAKWNMMLRLWAEFSQLSNVALAAMKESGALKKVIDSRKKTFVGQLFDIAHGMKKKNLDKFLEHMYHDYLPKGMPQEVANFMKMIGGGNALVPITAIFPDIADGDKKSASNGKKSNKKKRKGKKR